MNAATLVALEEQMGNVEIVEKFAITDIDETEDSTEALALIAGRAVMEEHDDEPIEVLRLDEGGWAVRGRNTLLVIPANGEPTLSPIGDGDSEVDEDDDDDDESDDLDEAAKTQKRISKHMSSAISTLEKALQHESEGMNSTLKIGLSTVVGTLKDLEEKASNPDESKEATVFIPTAAVSQFTAFVDKYIGETNGAVDTVDGGMNVTLPREQVALIIEGIEGAVETTVSATVGGYDSSTMGSEEDEKGKKKRKKLNKNKIDKKGGARFKAEGEEDPDASTIKTESITVEKSKAVTLAKAIKDAGLKEDEVELQANPDGSVVITLGEVQAAKIRKLLGIKK